MLPSTVYDELFKVYNVKDSVGQDVTVVTSDNQVRAPPKLRIKSTAQRGLAHFDIGSMHTADLLPSHRAGHSFATLSSVVFGRSLPGSG